MHQVTLSNAPSISTYDYLLKLLIGPVQADGCFHVSGDAEDRRIPEPRRKMYQKRAAQGYFLSIHYELSSSTSVSHFF